MLLSCAVGQRVLGVGESEDLLLGLELERESRGKQTIHPLFNLNELTTLPSVGGQTPAEGNCQKKSLYLALLEMR
jgi:hypothetical protein